MSKISSDSDGWLVPLIIRRGTPGDDELIGTNEPDTLTGRGGNDFLPGSGERGDPRGGRGAAQLFGGADSDLLRGGAGNDVLSGGAGYDELHGQGGNDELDGDAGADVLFGGGGVDLLHGGGGSDALFGNGAGDRLFGEDGNDLLDGKSGRDTLTGGDGVDLFAFTVLDGTADRITDLDLNSGETVDVSALLPSTFNDGNLDQFVRQTSIGDGVLLQLSPDGNGAFTDLALLLGVGPVQLSAAQLGADPASNAATTATLGLVDPVHGQLSRGSDADWFQIDLVAEQSYRFDLNGAEHALGTLRDPLLRLYDGGSEFVTADDDGGDGLDSQLVFTAPVSGTYFLSAEGFGGASGSYTLSATALGGPTEIPNDVSTRAAISDSGVARGALEAAGDTDWYGITLQAGHAYTFDLLGASTNSGTLFDPLLRLFDQSGSPVVENDDGGEGRNSRLEFTPTSDGVFFLAADSFGNGGTGTYELTSFTPNSGEVPDLAAPGLGGPQPGPAAVSAALTVADVLEPAAADGGAMAGAGVPAASVEMLPMLLTPADPAQAAVG